MPRHLVVPERSRIDVSARPALPGARLVVEGLSGWLDVDDPGTGTAGAGTAAQGSITIQLRVLVDEDGAVAMPVPAWLLGGATVEAAVEEARCEPDGRVSGRARCRLGDRSVTLTGAGYRRRPPGAPGHGGRAGGPEPVREAGDGPGPGIEAVGITLVDPRSLGFRLPPLISHTIHARWRLTLAT